MSYELHHGDCLQVLPTFANESYDCILTDPPYNHINRETGGLREIDKGVADSEPIDIQQCAKEFYRIAKHSIVVFCGDTQFSEWVNAFNALGATTRIGVWHKTNPSPMNGQKLYLSAMELCVVARKPKAYFNGHCIHALWTGASERVEGFDCPKPVWLMEELVNTLVPPGGSVLDAFLGSGTTGVASLRNGRTFAGIEKYQEHLDIARSRIELERMAQTQMSFMEMFA